MHFIKGIHILQQRDNGPEMFIFGTVLNYNGVTISVCILLLRYCFWWLYSGSVAGGPVSADLLSLLTSLICP